MTGVYRHYRPLSVADPICVCLLQHRRARAAVFGSGPRAEITAADKQSRCTLEIHKEGLGAKPDPV